MTLLRRMANEARDLLELILLPGIAAVLPWRLCFRLFKLLSRVDFLYAAECHQALRHAEALGWVRGDRRMWLRTRRLVTLVDHADFYLSRARSDRWLARYMHVDGHWPEPAKPGVLCTFHWGAGMWALRHIGAGALRVHAIVAPQVAQAFPGRTVKLLYSRARVRSVAKALRTDPIEPSHSPRPILRTLHQGEQIVAAVDVPSDTVAASESIEFLGTRAHVPRGLLRVAAHARIPVTVYVTRLGTDNGDRFLTIRTLPTRDNPAELMAEVFGFLKRAIEADPAAWHLWSVAPRFFVSGAPAVADAPPTVNTP